MGRLWRDRHDLWRLVKTGNHLTLGLLDVLTRRFNVVVAGLDPEDLGWLSVADAMRQGGGLAKKVHVLVDWDPRAEGVALRWDVSVSLLRLGGFLLATLWTLPWAWLWRTLVKKPRSRRDSSGASLRPDAKLS